MRFDRLLTSSSFLSRLMRGLIMLGVAFSVRSSRKRRLQAASEITIAAVDGDLEMYRQAANDARAYMDMRNKHFSTFLVINGILLAGLFEVSSLTSKRILIASLGLAVTILFWLLDYRMAQYLRGSIALVRLYEEKLHRPPIDMAPGRRLLPATLISNLLFMMMLALWLYLIFLQKILFK